MASSKSLAWLYGILLIDPYIRTYGLNVTKHVGWIHYDWQFVASQMNGSATESIMHKLYGFTCFSSNQLPCQYVVYVTMPNIHVIHACKIVIS